MFTCNETFMSLLIFLFYECNRILQVKFPALNVTIVTGQSPISMLNVMTVAGQWTSPPYYSICYRTKPCALDTATVMEDGGGGTPIV